MHFGVCILLIALAYGSPATAQSTFTPRQICKAGIAVVMGRVPATMKVDRVRENVVFLSYNRPDDGKRWTYKCKIEGERIIWGADDGRWRTHPEDSVISFAIDGSSLVVAERFSDGSSNEETFTRKQLGR